jgi:hypothetical protein
VTRPWFSGVRHVPAELPLNRWQRRSIAADARHAWLRHRSNGVILFGWLLLQMVFAAFALGTLDWLREQQGWPDLSVCGRVRLDARVLVLAGADAAGVCVRRTAVPRARCVPGVWVSAPGVGGGGPVPGVRGGGVCRAAGALRPAMESGGVGEG